MSTDGGMSAFYRVEWRADWTREFFYPLFREWVDRVETTERFEIALLV